jgi:hypothetical protein
MAVSLSNSALGSPEARPREQLTLRVGLINVADVERVELSTSELATRRSAGIPGQFLRPDRMPSTELHARKEAKASSSGFPIRGCWLFVFMYIYYFQEILKESQGKPACVSGFPEL